MKNTFLLFLLLLAGCDSNDSPCPSFEDQWLLVGFYRSGANQTGWDGLPLDTTFTSIYPIGSRAELSNRRVDNFFLFPIPLKGGRVTYVFQSGDLQDTLSLNLKTSAVVEAIECGVRIRLEGIDLVQEDTSIRADSISFGYYFPYYGTKAVASSLAIFVP